jgi:hypothetical protein
MAAGAIPATRPGAMLRPVVSVFLLSSSVLACSGGDAAQEQPDASGSAIDAAAPDADNVDAPQGFVNLTAQEVDDQPFWGYSVYLMAPTAGGAACYWGEPRGACCIGLGPVEVPDHLSAGTLTLENQTTGMSGQIPWLAEESDYGFLSPAFPWSPGDALSVSAEGDEVAGFTAATSFPSPLEGLEADTAIALSSDWTVRWTPAGASRVVVKLFAGDHSLACPAPDEDGALTIPAALLDEAFDAGEGNAFITRVSAGAAEEDPAIALEGELSVSSPILFEP